MSVFKLKDEKKINTEIHASIAVGKQKEVKHSSGQRERGNPHMQHKTHWS